MFRHILRRAIPYRRYATRQRRSTPAPVVDIESQISEFPEEQRKQILDQVHGDLPQISRKETGGDDFTANLILEFLENAESPADLDDGFWKTVRGLAKSATQQKKAEYLEIFAALFDSAKDIEKPELRQEMLFTIGRYIYRQKQVRMDPINEVEFLDTLVAKGRVFNALNYWRSRKTKPDVAGSVYWPEVGVLYHLEAGLLRRADAIATGMTKELNGYTPPRVVVSLIDAYSRHIRRGRDVAFAKQRLEGWTKKLLSASVIYRNAEVESDELLSLEDKLQERKDVSSSDMTKAFTAIIAARQWDLAATLANSFEMMNEDLMKALELSVTSMHQTEDSVMPFLDTILTQDPKRVSDGRVAATIVLSFARSGDIDDMSEILHDMRNRQLELPDRPQAFIAREILRQQSLTLEQKISTIKNCLGSPAAAREVVRWLRRKADKQSIAEYWAHYDGEITGSLALDVLRSRIENSEAEIIRLGVSQESWKYIWYLAASKKVSLDPRTVLKAMLQQHDNGFVKLTDSLMSMVIPAIIVTNASVVEGAAKAIAVMQFISNKYKIPISSAHSTVLLETAKKVSRRQLVLFTPPSRKDFTAALLKGTKCETIPFERLLKQTAEILRADDLGLLVEKEAQDLLN